MSVLPTTPQKPTCVQPGGGTCMAIESLWGRCRRAWLRLARPGYVRLMQSLRQGSCPDCCHDIIDPRNLKYVRNVCGFWFRPEDDRFRWRARLGFARYGLAELIISSIFCWCLGTLAFVAAWEIHAGFWLLFTTALVFWLEIVYFFRDPKRSIPTETKVLVSPADGTITNIEEVEEPDFESGRALRISMFLSIFNVHVNRMPQSAQVVEVRYFPGAYLDARNPLSAIRNEQLWVDLIEPGTGLSLRVKQISGAIARRIVCWVKPGDQLEQGERFGMIKFGSRTDLLLPVGQAKEICIKVGDKVQGGSTILLRLKE